MAVREVVNHFETAGTVQPTPRTSRPDEKQPTVHWTAPDNYNKLNDFEIKVRNILLTNSYNI